METFLVGGAVRDKWLKLPIKDRDWVVTGSHPKQMIAKGFKPVGKDFPVFLHPETNEEYALARTERKTAEGYHGFEFHANEHVTLEEDLQRRDLTINALAENAAGQLIDYYGGKQDLENKTLRHVSPAFQEDPVRILRVARFMARFASLGFHVADETMTLMQKMVSNGEVNSLVAERVWQETQKALTEPHPEKFFITLRECGALKVLFPEIDRLFGVPQKKEYHPEVDTGIHTMMVLQQAVLLSDNPIVRFAALVHDLGKGITPKEILPAHHGHEIASRKLVIELCQRYKIPNDYRKTAELVAEYHTHVHKAFELTPKKLLKVLRNTDAFRQPERFTHILLACKADSRGRTGYENREYKQVEFYQSLRNACAKVNIQDFVQQGHNGERIKQELHQRRLNAIKAVIG